MNPYRDVQWAATAPKTVRTAQNYKTHGKLSNQTPFGSDRLHKKLLSEERLISPKLHDRNLNPSGWKAPLKPLSVDKIPSRMSSQPIRPTFLHESAVIRDDSDEEEQVFVSQKTLPPKTAKLSTLAVLEYLFVAMILSWVLGTKIHSWTNTKHATLETSSTLPPTAHMDDYYFETQWQELDYQGPTTGNNMDQLGYGVAVSGDGSTVAALSHPDDGRVPALVRLFHRHDDDTLTKVGSDIQLEQTCGPNDNNPNNRIFRMDLNEKGNIVAVTYASPTTWYVRVFSLQEQEWTQLGRDIRGDGFYGLCVSLSASGHVLAVGGNGHLRILRYQGTNWIQEENDITIPGDGIAWSCSLSQDGNTVAIGDLLADSPQLGKNTGQVLVYRYEPLGYWTAVGTPIFGMQAHDHFGTAVALDAAGACVAAGGVPIQGKRPGFVRMLCQDSYTREWVTQGNIVYGQDGWDHFGLELDLSGDGRTLVVGAHRFNSEQVGADVGQVSIFRLDQEYWAPIATFEGEAPRDNLGWSVSLSNAGDILATGADMSKGTGYRQGQLMVFRESTTHHMAEPIHHNMAFNASH